MRAAVVQQFGRPLVIEDRPIPRVDLSEVFALHAARRTRVIYEDRHLSEVNEAIDEVLQGRATARLVLRPSTRTPVRSDASCLTTSPGA